MGDDRDDGLHATAVAIDRGIERRPELEDPVMSGQIGGRLGGLQIDGVELVPFSDLDQSGDACLPAPAGEYPRLKLPAPQLGRQPPAGRGDHEPVDDEARKKSQRGE